MKVTIKDRYYELKELTKEEAKEYIGKEVYVWDSDVADPTKRKLLEVYEPSCTYPFCVLRPDGTGTHNFIHCAFIPEEWYVYEKPNGKFFYHYATFELYKEVDHGSHEYCKQKAEELNNEKMPCSECKHNDEPEVVCSGCDNKSMFERKESAEHPLTNYELVQLLKCFGVECSMIGKCSVQNFFTYEQSRENKIALNTFIRYKCGEWMPATRETVMKWWGEEVPNSDIARFISFMSWDEDK